tara:strand:+ start:707 stop:1006 length:300 start_codon:yes stop_codon:yes gene_type:complete
MERLYPVTTIETTENMSKYPSTPIGYVSYPDQGIVRLDRPYRATIQFYTGITGRNPRGTWAMDKVFNDSKHLDNFLGYIKRTKGWNVDEVWYGHNTESR